jgi:hypothetical protein
LPNQTSQKPLHSTNVSSFPPFPLVHLSTHHGSLYSNKISPQDQEAAESETMMMNAVFFAIFTKASDFG